MTVDQRPIHQLPHPRPSPGVRVVEVSVTPRSWLGKLLAGAVAVAVIGLALLLSLFAFVAISAIFAAGLLAFLWQTRAQRRRRTFDVTAERLDDQDGRRR